MPKSSTSFQPGQSGNPTGRPSTRRKELNELLESVFKDTDRRAVLTKLIEDARKGDHDARTLLMAYTWGRPIERREVSGPDGEPLFKIYEGVDPDAV